MAWLAAVVVVAALAVLSPKLLLGWYVYEVRRRDVPENPEETIVTYPLA